MAFSANSEKSFASFICCFVFPSGRVCRGKSTVSNGEYNTHFRVNITNPILCSLEEELHISVMSVEIPYSFYNISSNLLNNTLVYDTNNTLTFDNQDYDIDDLVAYCNADTNFSATNKY